MPDASDPIDPGVTILADQPNAVPDPNLLAGLSFHAVLAFSLPVFIPVTALAMHEPLADQVCFNGVSSFIDALRTNEISYSDYYRMLPENRAFVIARHEAPEANVPGNAPLGREPFERRPLRAVAHDERLNVRHGGDDGRQRVDEPLGALDVDELRHPDEHRRVAR